MIPLLSGELAGVVISGVSSHKFPPPRRGRGTMTRRPAACRTALGGGRGGVKPGKDVKDQNLLLSAPREGEAAEKSRDEAGKIDSVGR
jgi:hypothetical protein